MLALVNIGGIVIKFTVHKLSEIKSETLPQEINIMPI